ncbi:MAG: hypothetical protein EAX81_06670 [Candidatus Thorarchaeota archaeon]|nr:hypothetical protein [Candidatus Thorarchaeota archaeon]
MEEEWKHYYHAQEGFKRQSEIARYFIQGLPFALVSVGFIGLLDIVMLISSPVDFEGFIVIMFGLSILVITILGALNSVLAAVLWDIQPRQTCTSFAGQGAAFAIMTYVVDPILLIVLVSISLTFLSDIALYGIAFIILSLVSGYLGKHIAAEFEEERKGTEELASIHDRHMTCPHCGRHTFANLSTTDAHHGTLCPACGRWFGVDEEGPGLE